VSMRGKILVDEIGVYLHRIIGILHRPPWTDPVEGGLRVETVVTVSFLTAMEGVSAMNPPLPDPPLEEGQTNLLQGLVSAYSAQTSDQMEILNALSVSSRIS
jgi:hypothetical protein